MKRYFLFAVLALGISACGGGATEGETNENSNTQAAESQEMESEEMQSEQKEVPKEVTVKLYTVGETMQTMQYEPNKIEVPAGAEVTLILQNKAKSEAMIHNAVIIEAGKQSSVTDAALEAGPDQEYLPESGAIIAATKLANPGETVEVTFTAPEKKGTYQYICTYPGHTSMKGVMLVQ